MKELITKIQESYQAFVKDANLQVENGNKAAGVLGTKGIAGNREMMKRISQSISRKREEIIGQALRYSVLAILHRPIRMKGKKRA